MKITEYTQLGNLINSIYKITNPYGKVYVGKFTHIKRINRYVNMKCKAQKKVYNSLNKYGIENHTIEILQTIPNSQGLNGLEKLYIKMYDSFNNGLNCNLGGQSGYKYSDQFCKQLWQLNKNGMNFSQIGRKFNLKSPSVVNLINRTGNIPIKHKKINSVQMRIKISQSMSGQNHPLFGKKHTQETRDKMKLKCVGRPSNRKGMKLIKRISI